MIKYRPEIDGLRALAVLPVILFHAGFDLFSGGYVGVDVFFVISGYLITGIIYSEIQEGSFSLLRFYERRVRRILPALFVVSLACIPFAWLWMMPNEFKSFAQSLVAVNLFSSNILFLRESGYFANAAELKPLLHTWSLAVEEQFYLVFPLFLLLLKRSRQRSLLLLLVTLAVASLGLAEWGARNYPLANFYLLPSRCWELAVGAILAVGAVRIGRGGGLIAEVGGGLGIGLMAFSFIAFEKTTPMPGVWGLVPVLGTALVIVCASSSTFVGRALGWRPIVGIGLISYSAYLWHQPLFAFARIRLWNEVSPLTYLGLSVLALCLAYLSWRFVEQPCRNRGLFDRKTIFSGAVAISSALMVFGVIGHFNSGIPSRHHDAELARKLERGLKANRGLSPACSREFNLSAECRTDEDPEIVVWGDSYAMHIIDGILSSNPQAAVVQMTSSHCGPFIDIAPITLPSFTEKKAGVCLDFNSKVQEYISKSETLDYAVLSSPFTQYLRDGALVYYNGKVVEPDFDFVVARFKATLEWLVRHNIKPVIFEAPPRSGRNIGLCLARNAWFGTDRQQCNIPISDYNSLTPGVLAFLAEIEQTYSVVRMKDYLCREQECIGEEQGVFIYRDAGHLSREGSRHIGRMMNFYGMITDD